MQALTSRYFPVEPSTIVTIQSGGINCFCYDPVSITSTLLLQNRHYEHTDGELWAL